MKTGDLFLAGHRHYMRTLKAHIIEAAAQEKDIKICKK